MWNLSDVYLTGLKHTMSLISAMFSDYSTEISIAVRVYKLKLTLDIVMSDNGYAVIDIQ